MHRLCVSAFEKPATYWHMLPEAAQARKAVWEAVNPHTGLRRIDEAYPIELRDVTRENEMFIRFKNGSTLNIVGSDNYNSLVGSPPYGIVFSEWAVAHPASWAYLSPILRENGGWAAFISTPRGKNHFWTMEKAARAEDWFVQVSRADETGVFTTEQLEAEKRELIGMYGVDMGTALYDQEYLVSFDAAVMGSYYGAELAQAEREGRIARVEPDPHAPVHTAWDLGKGANMAIWFFQIIGSRINVVDYHQSPLANIENCATVIIGKGYRRGDDWVPHDAKVIEIGTGRSRIETMIKAGLRPRLVPDHYVDDGINALRLTLRRCWFDGERCAEGLEALKQYQREWDEGKRTFKDNPLHNWASHPADAARYMAMAWREDQPEKPKPEDRILSIGRLNGVTLDDMWDQQTVRRRSRI